MSQPSEATAPHRYFCHQCQREIIPRMPDMECPLCSSGFIEEMEDIQPSQASVTPPSPGIQLQMPQLGMLPPPLQAYV